MKQFSKRDGLNMKKEVKQVIIVRKDLKMGVGKIAAQSCHASLLSFIIAEKSYPDIVKKWLGEGGTKIVLRTENEVKFEEIKKVVKNSGIPHVVVKDAGQTQIPPGTETAIGIGPYYSDDIDYITSKLKLL